MNNPSPAQPRPRSIATRRHLLGLTGALGLAALWPQAARAQAAWPSKPFRFVVPFAPGGSSEIVARSVAAELSRTLGQSAGGCGAGRGSIRCLPGLGT